ncbi:hypothetical protein HYU23_02765 [Candidatus Woesearchaeota archaeon]|nr:hypothetical protein [Candidatus Woesearchaeota archaeon]
MKYSLKKDKFRENRGNYSRLLQIYCRKCEKPLFLYQKDGPGNLRRLYLDRIINKEKMKNLKMLKCENCKEILGTKYIYKKENRNAFRLYQDTIIKKIRKLKYVQENN